MPNSQLKSQVFFRFRSKTRDDTVTYTWFTVDVTDTADPSGAKTEICAVPASRVDVVTAP